MALEGRQLITANGGGAPVLKALHQAYPDLAPD